MASPYVCATCGLSIGYWFHGWKHQSGWRSNPSCGKKPIPVPRSLPTAKPAGKAK